MKRPNALTASSLVAAAIVALAAGPARSETIYYQFPALPGQASDCQWFDDNINDRSTDSVVRQTDMIYNRLALTPNATVRVSGSATTQQGAQVVQFDVAGRLLCADAAAITQPTPAPSSSPSSSPAASPSV